MRPELSVDIPHSAFPEQTSLPIVPSPYKWTVNKNGFFPPAIYAGLNNVIVFSPPCSGSLTISGGPPIPVPYTYTVPDTGELVIVTFTPDKGSQVTGAIGLMSVCVIHDSGFTPSTIPMNGCYGVHFHASGTIGQYKIQKLKDGNPTGKAEYSPAKSITWDYFCQPEDHDTYWQVTFTDDKTLGHTNGTITVSGTGTGDPRR